jgi:hypothetical protein
MYFMCISILEASHDLLVKYLSHRESLLVLGVELSYAHSLQAAVPLSTIQDLTSQHDDAH